MRAHCGWTLLLIGLAIAATAWAQAATVEGVRWPDRWVMFGPISWEKAGVDPAQFREVPDRLRIGGEEHAGTPVQFDGDDLDISSLLGGHERRETVYLLGEVHAEHATEVLIGAAADWWMAWWLNGEPLYDTLEGGNGGQDFSLGAHVFRASLKPGTNVLAVRVSGGREGFALTAGIPPPERWDALLQGRRDEQRRERLSDLIARALSAQKAGDQSEARSVLSEAGQVATPGSHIALSLRLRMGESYERSGQFAQARGVYEALLAGPLPSWARPVVQLRLAQTLRAAGETEGARRAYAELARMPDAHPLTVAAATEALGELRAR